MKTLYIALTAAVAASVIALLSCSDGLSTDEVRPLASEEDMVCGVVTRGLTHIPVANVGVVLYKREVETDLWTSIDVTWTNNEGYYEFHIESWPAGWYGKVDCTNDDITAATDFPIYPEEGPVEADIWFPI